MAESKSQPIGASRKPKHVPLRTCVACRRTEAKRALIRIVRDAAGRVAVDPTGKRNGRGAYLCHDPNCWAAALKRKALERALRLDYLHPDDREMLLEFGKTLALPESVSKPGEDTARDDLRRQ